jgi:hypothetical protein
LREISSRMRCLRRLWLGAYFEDALHHEVGWVGVTGKMRVKVTMDQMRWFEKEDEGKQTRSSHFTAHGI